MACHVSVSIGELCDKITILQIKKERICDEEKQSKIARELEAIIPMYATYGVNNEIMTRLKTVNECLWEIEDKIREKERQQEFDNEFISLARSVYITNDERFAIKNEINMTYNSEINEVKSYSQYT
jgi:hypothetical protein